jgi:oxygen-independent coproporphyrinogen-3 oxidase
VIGLDPEHISAYSLIVEEGTPFYDLYDSGKLDLPEEDVEREMYHLTKTILSEAGYQRYEISNYAKPGFACRHNIRYWRREPYLGFGVGAASMYGELVPFAVNSALKGSKQTAISPNEGDIKNYFISCCGRFSGQYRRTNDTDFIRYLRHYDLRESGGGKAWDGENTTTCLSLKDSMEEFMFLGLRMTEGISAEDFDRRFGPAGEGMSSIFSELYGAVVRKYIGMGLMEMADGRIRLTDRGIDVSNVVLADFLLDDE